MALDRTALPIALVIGGGAIEVVRSLQIAGLPCAVVSTPGDATKYSTRCTPVFHWDWTQPLEAHDEALADRLVAWAQAQPEPPVLESVAQRHFNWMFCPVAAAGKLTTVVM